jgi:hypothetical protein
MQPGLELKGRSRFCLFVPTFWRKNFWATKFMGRTLITLQVSSMLEEKKILNPNPSLPSKKGATTFGRMTLNMMTLRIRMLSIATFGIMTFGLKTLT